MSDLVLARNFSLARMLPGEAELVSEWTGPSGKAKSVKRFERSNGLDTALYKNYLYLTSIVSKTMYFTYFTTMQKNRFVYLFAVQLLWYVIMIQTNPVDT